MAEGQSALDRHDRIVLQFSGGRDSIACLLAVEPWWHKIVVLWGNRGADYPETLEVIEFIKRLPVQFAEAGPPIPHELSMQVHGYPVDVIPTRNVEDVATLTGQPILGPKVQSYLSCCNRMLWQPMQRFCDEYGATLIVRGQRNDEAMKSPVRSGDVIDGVEYLFPLENMTEAEVDGFIRSKGWSLPEHYDYTGKGLDCWSCTAYLHESQDRLAYTKHFHPDLWRRLAPRLRAVQHITRRELQYLDAAVALTED